MWGDFNTVTEGKDRDDADPFKLSRESKVLPETCESASLSDLCRTLYPLNTKTKTIIDIIYVP